MAVQYQQFDTIIELQDHQIAERDRDLEKIKEDTVIIHDMHSQMAEMINDQGAYCYIGMATGIFVVLLIIVIILLGTINGSTNKG